VGTDIHFAAEVKNDEGNWEFIPGPIIECWACDGTGVARHQPGKPCWSCNSDPAERDEFDRDYLEARYVQPGKVRDTWYSDRNYAVFAILGNVRNGRGFAGVYTHDPLPWISDSRGIPENATPETLAVLSDEHSGTWCTLAEVLAYDWHRPIHRGGVISLAQYAECKRTGQRPDSWSGGISGGNNVTVSPEQADRFLAGSNTGGMTVHVNYEWDDTLDDFTSVFRDRMKMLAMEVGERECRLIFDFDS